MLFHEKLDIQLIRAVKDNPVLYDHNHAKYMDFNTREVAWQKIGDELKRPGAMLIRTGYRECIGLWISQYEATMSSSGHLSVDKGDHCVVNRIFKAADCKVRWINIRDVYRRLLRKALVTGNRPKLYKYENEIAFMRPFYKDVSVQLEEFESDDRSNQGNDDCNDDCNDEGAAECYNSDEPERKPKINLTRPKSSAKKKRRKRFAEAVVDPMSIPSFSEVTVPTEFDSADPVDAFLLSIGATLKTFSPYHLNLAKSKIFSVVQEHDLQQIVQKEQQSEGTPQNDVKITATETIYMQ